MKKNKGYVLLMTIVITFVLSLTAITMMSIVYRYNTSILKRKDKLQQEVYDPKIVTITTNDSYYFDI